jgi:hypothetical protein
MKPAVSPSALRVQAALGDGHLVLEFDRSVRTAAEAAATIGCTVAQIAKSIVFRAVNSGRPVLVIASGANRSMKIARRSLWENPSRAPMQTSCAKPPALRLAAFPRSHTRTRPSC